MTVRWTDDMLNALQTLRKAERQPLVVCAERIGVAYLTALDQARKMGLADRLNRGRRPGPAVAADADMERG